MCMISYFKSYLIPAPGAFPLKILALDSDSEKTLREVKGRAQRHGSAITDFATEHTQMCRGDHPLLLLG